MALKKAEMQSHQSEYHTLISKARSALHEGRYSEAVEIAMSSWDYIDGMMQFERKYEGKEFDNLEGIDIVLDYAPLLFDCQSLDKLKQLLQNQRRIDKHASDDLADKLAKAKTLMWDAHRLWDHLERLSESSEDELWSVLGGDQNVWRTIAEKWEQMGIVGLTQKGRSNCVQLRTRMDESVLAKCPSCAAVVKGRKTRLLGEQVCPKCNISVVFVLLANVPSADK